MGIEQNLKTSFTPYVMLFITLLLIAGTTMYLSHFSTTEEQLKADKNLIPLNGPWKFTTGDNMQYAQSNYDDSGWEAMDLTAPPGAHDDDVGLTGYLPGWTAKGHPGYSGYAWYRLRVPLDSLRTGNLALAAPPAVDNAYQLFINGSLSGNAGDFSGETPITYSIQPRMFLLPESAKSGTSITIAFRVWMSPAGLSQGAGGIHIAPTLGEKTSIRKKYRFQWEQTIKGYIVEVVLPVMFVLLAATMFILNRSRKPAPSYKWFITALVLVGLLRLNQAVYFWFQIESGQQATVVGSVILRPLVLGSWLMAWREWFDLRRPKWLPGIIALLTLLFMAAQLFSLSWVSHDNHTRFQTIGDYLRWLLLAIMLFTFFRGIRKQGAKDALVFLALLLVSIAMYPQEVSYLHIIPGIWFPYGVGVSRGQFFYAFFVVVIYIILIRKERRLFTI
jgi:hypothetical protein